MGDLGAARMEKAHAVQHAKGAVIAHIPDFEVEGTGAMGCKA